MRVLSYLLLVASFIAVASAIKCYVCNSISNPDCAENFEKLSSFCPIKTFGGKKSQKAIGCRISRQHAKEEYSVVRECAYTGSNVEGKSQKGSLGVGRVVTQCDQNLCNESSHISLVVPAISAVFFVFFR